MISNMYILFCLFLFVCFSFVLSKQLIGLQIPFNTTTITTYWHTSQGSAPFRHCHLFVIYHMTFVDKIFPLILRNIYIISFVLTFPRHGKETIWKQRLYVAKVLAKFAWKLPYVFQELSYAHLPNFSNVCALSNLVSLFIKFDVCSKHAFTSFFLMFTKRAQQTKKAFVAAYFTEFTVWCRLMSCLMQFKWNLLSFLAWPW